jgi:hypothetical protein
MGTVRNWLMNLFMGDATKEALVDGNSPPYLLFYNLTKGFLWATVGVALVIRNPWMVGFGFFLAVACATFAFLLSRETQAGAAPVTDAPAPVAETAPKAATVPDI